MTALDDPARPARREPGAAVAVGAAGQAGTVRTGATAAEASHVRLLDRPLASYYLVLGSTALLIVLGLVMVLSASSVRAFQDSGSSFYFFQRQALWVAIGLPLLLGAGRLRPRTYRVLAYPLLLSALALLVLVLVPGIGRNVNGNQNWIDVGGPFRLQPSETAKLALIVWGADLLARKRKLLVQWKHLLVPFVPVAGLVVSLVLLGGDLGTSLILMSVVAALLFVAGAPLRLFALMLAAGGGLVGYLTMNHSERLERLSSWLDPFADYQNGGWQAAHGIFALASGGWWGVGLGASRQKWGTLPEAHTDFIFAIVGEELGLVGTLVLLGLFATLGYAGIRIAGRSADPFVRVAAAGVTAWITVQALVNIGAVIGALPITGVPLPLVSYGGSAMLPTMLAIGMLLSFARDEPGARAALRARGPGSFSRLLRRVPLRRRR